MSEERSEEMTIDEIIKMLADARADLEILKEQLDLTGLEEYYDDILNQVDIVGCELTQNIAKKLKEK